MEKAAKRNRAALARDGGRRQCMFEITAELDEMIELVRDKLEEKLGRCSRVRALEAMAREGGKRLLREGK